MNSSKFIGFYTATGENNSMDSQVICNCQKSVNKQVNVKEKPDYTIGTPKWIQV